MSTQSTKYSKQTPAQIMVPSPSHLSHHHQQPPLSPPSEPADTPQILSESDTEDSLPHTTSIPNSNNNNIPSQSYQQSLSKKQSSILLKILNLLKKHPLSPPFSVPVTDDIAPDYSSIIKHPMDLSTIGSKLLKGTYKTPADFVSDVRLVWDNCSLYNHKGDYIWNCGQTLSTVFERALDTEFPGWEGVAGGGPTNAVGRRMASNKSLECCDEEEDGEYSGNSISVAKRPYTGKRRGPKPKGKAPLATNTSTDSLESVAPVAKRKRGSISSSSKKSEDFSGKTVEDLSATLASIASQMESLHQKKRKRNSKSVAATTSLIASTAAMMAQLVQKSKGSDAHAVHDDSESDSGSDSDSSDSSSDDSESEDDIDRKLKSFEARRLLHQKKKEKKRVKAEVAVTETKMKKDKHTPTTASVSSTNMKKEGDSVAHLNEKERNELSGWLEVLPDDAVEKVLEMVGTGGESEEVELDVDKMGAAVARRLYVFVRGAVGAA